MLWLSRLTVLIALGVAVAGCQTEGPPVAKVTGSVTLGGQPVTNGIVIFQSPDGAESLTAELNAGGQFELRTHTATGLPPGKYRVAVKPVAPVSTTPPLADDAVNNPQPADSIIPQKYYSVETSGLTAEVKLDQPNDFPLVLVP